jgi:hypothetical protein
LERLTDQVIHEVDFGAAHVGERDGVDNDNRSITFDYDVIWGARRV